MMSQQTHWQMKWLTSSMKSCFISSTLSGAYWLYQSSLIVGLIANEVKFSHISLDLDKDNSKCSLLTHGEDICWNRGHTSLVWLELLKTCLNYRMKLRHVLSLLIPCCHHSMKWRNCKTQRGSLFRWQPLLKCMWYLLHSTYATWRFSKRCQCSIPKVSCERHWEHPIQGCSEQTCEALGNRRLTRISQ